MAVPATERRLPENLFGQNLAESNNHRHIGIQGIELLLALRIPSDSLRGEHRTVQLESSGFDR